MLTQSEIRALGFLLDEEGIHPEPLTDLLVRDKTWQWTENERFAYAYLGRRLLSGTACSYPDFKGQFILKSDACGSTVGAVLSQKEDGDQGKIVACASQKLNGSQLAWSTYEVVR